MHGPVEGLAGTRTPLPHDPRQLPQCPVPQSPAARQRVVGGCKYHQLVRSPVAALQLGVIELALDQPHVQLKARHLLGDGRGIGHAQGDLRPRVAAAKLGDHGHRQVVAYGQGGAHPQSAHDLFPRQRLFEGPGLLQQGFGPGPQLAAQFAQLQALADPVEQAHLELFLQFPQRAAGSGLGHGQVRRGPGHVLVPGGGQEHLQLAQTVAHGDTPISGKSIYIIK